MPRQPKRGRKARRNPKQPSLEVPSAWRPWVDAKRKSSRPDRKPPETAYVRTYGCKRSFVLKQFQPKTIRIQTVMQEDADGKHVTFQTNRRFPDHPATEGYSRETLEVGRLFMLDHSDLPGNCSSLTKG